MESLIQLAIVLLICTVLISEAVDNKIRNWFGMEKVTDETISNKFETWMKIFLALLFAVASNLIGLESSYHYLVIYLYCVTFYGMEALFEKQKNKNSMYYLFPILGGVCKAIPIMILFLLYNAAGRMGGA
ncbi:hypothetical protein [Pradoshia sp.]